MKKVNLFIPVEIKKRDFASRSLVGFAASLKGFNVYIGRKFEIDKIVFKKNPGIYLGLVTTKTYAPFYKKLKDYGHFIFVNDEDFPENRKNPGAVHQQQRPLPCCGFEW